MGSAVVHVTRDLVYTFFSVSSLFPPSPSLSSVSPSFPFPFACFLPLSLNPVLTLSLSPPSCLYYPSFTSSFPSLSSFLLSPFLLLPPFIFSSLPLPLPPPHPLAPHIRATGETNVDNKNQSFDFLSISLHMSDNEKEKEEEEVSSK